MAELLFPEESYAIMGACFAVYKDKGCGFNEPVYQECMEIELAHLGIPFEAQRELRLTYRGKALRSKFVPDLICFERIIVELKAVSKLADEHEAQVLNYLHATRMELGILANFGHWPKLESRRIALSNQGRRRPRRSRRR